MSTVMQTYSDSCIVKLLWTVKFPSTNNIIIMVLKFDVSSHLLASTQPWQIGLRFGNIQR